MASTKKDPQTGLTAKQAAFVEEYLVDLNATQAAIRAGYSKKTANFLGMENLRRPHVAAAIKMAMDERSQRTKITQDDVLRSWFAIATADIRDVVEWKMGALGSEEQEAILPTLRARDSADLPPNISSAIADVSMSRDGTIRVKMHDKMRALDSLARHLGMFEKDNEQVGKAAAGTVAALIEQAQKTPLLPRQHDGGDDDG